MSSPSSKDLLEDRIKFKFHAAKEHLKNLKSIESQGGIIKDAETRIRTEIEIEDLLAHLIGARDALLGRMNKKLKLGIPERELFVPNVTTELKNQNWPDLLKPYNDLLDPNINPKPSWLKILNKIRNTGTHNNILNVRASVNLVENVNTGKGSAGPTRVYFKDDPDTNLEVIPYLEDRIQQMEALIQRIINKDPSLSSLL